MIFLNDELQIKVFPWLYLVKVEQIQWNSGMEAFIAHADTGCQKCVKN